MRNRVRPVAVSLIGLLVAVLTLVATLAGVGVNLLAWLFPGVPERVAEVTPPPAKTDPLVKEGGEGTQPERPEGPTVRPVVRPRKEPSEPQETEVTLGAGQQRVLFGGDLALGADFSQIGSQFLATLHIQAGQGPVTNKAILAGGRNYQVHGSHGTYKVWVLRIDADHRELEVQAARVYEGEGPAPP